LQLKLKDVEYHFIIEMEACSGLNFDWFHTYWTLCIMV